MTQALPFPLLLLLCLPLLLLYLPLLLLCAQLLASLPPRRQRAPWSPHRPPLAVLVPAHNEAAGILVTLRAIQRQLTPADRLIVVADNCSDDTAALARAAGDVIVVERDDPQLRGKAHALAFGLRWLARQPAAIIICIDADCTLGAQAVDRLAQRCLASQRPAQACYLMHACAPVTKVVPDASNPYDAQRQASAFAWRIKNCLRALGRERLGMACQLTGSGMALPWQPLDSVELTNHLAEDLALGLALAARGHAPVYCHEATIHSHFANNEEGARIQRTRWEHGHLHLLSHYAPRHLFGAIRRRDWRYASLSLDLCIPPLSLLLMLTAVASLGPLLAWQATGDALPWLLLLLPPAALPLSLAATWAVHGRDLLPARQLLAGIAYVCGKLPLYLRRRQRDWVGTRRD